MHKGLVVILSGASSVGKGSIREKLLADQDMKLFYSISETTRPQKEGEVDGKDYYFVSYKDFAESVKNKELLEYTEFNGFYYGTPKAQVEFLTDKGKNVLIEVEAQGVGPIKLNIPDALAFFVMPSSFEELEKQVNENYKDNKASIEMRLNKAKMDMELAPLFRNVVYNDDLDKAVAQIKATVMEELEKRGAGKD
ncbi:MAG: guanylate kinase [Eubacteriales bacterium]|nr:guanylate kinase [Eubacteriales bacterium]